MTATIVPYGRLAGGNYGVLLDSATGKSLASVIEVLSTLPAVASTDNFSGRLVFSQADYILYIYVPATVPYWKPLEGVPTNVSNAAGSPPTVPVPIIGQLHWDLDTEVLFVWNSSAWVKAGGRYAAQIYENNYTGDAATTTFASGSSQALASEYVEVFLDGVRQVAGIDYALVGTTVTFVTAPAAAVVIYVRAMETASIVQTAQIAGAQYVATASQTDFITGMSGSDPSGVFVYKAGLLQTLTTDYTLVQHDVSILALTRASLVATVSTTLVHSLVIGSIVTLVNFTEPEYNNLTVTVTGLPTNSKFTFTAALTDSATGTPNGTAYYTPAFTKDIVRFNTGLTVGDAVDIRSLASVVVNNATGEINLLSSTGSGTTLHTAKVGATLNIKSLKSGANMTITDNGTDVTLAASTGTGYEDRIATSISNTVVVDPTSYVGVRNTLSATTVDISGIGAAGRRITIKDEIGIAATFAINIKSGGGTFDGAASPYVISTNYGSVSLTSDGINWFITAIMP
jgi:hypothetical protein